MTRKRNRRPQRSFARGTKTALFSALALIGVGAAALPDSRAAQTSGAATKAQLYDVLPATPAQLTAQRILASQIDAIGRGFNGDVGIAVKDVQTGWTADYDGRGHFPQQSVSKFWVALTALDKADRGELSLFNPVTVRKSDLTLFNQPIAQQVGPNGYTTTIRELVQRALQQSDNTCNDFVLWRAGGPDAVRDFLRRKGIEGIRFGPGERVMQARIAGMEWKPSYVGSGFYAARNQVPASVRRASFESYVSNPVDGATPLGLVDALARLKRGELLSPASTAWMLSTMSNTRTGPRRLKGGLSAGWTLAHKTGTGQVLGGTQSGYNDIGVITGPDGRSYAIAVMIRKTSTPIVNRMEMMQSVTRAVVAFDRNARGYNVAGTDYFPGSSTGSN